MKTTIIVDSWDIERYPLLWGKKRKGKKKLFSPLMEQQFEIRGKNWESSRTSIE
jgi:hypothetical protein